MRRFATAAAITCILSWLAVSVAVAQRQGDESSSDTAKPKFSVEERRLQLDNQLAVFDRDSREKAAGTIAGSILFAGIAIGAGVYFGLRSLRQTKAVRETDE